MNAWSMRQACVALALGIALALSAAQPHAQSAAAQQPRLGFKGLYPGMPAADLPAPLTATGNMGEREGFVGSDYIQVQFVGGTVTQIAVVYYSEPIGSTPRLDRRVSLDDAWRIHGPRDGVPEFAFYIAYLQRIEGLIDTRNFMAYRLRFPKPEFSRTAPALFDPRTLVERVVYASDRVELALNHQPIPSRELLETIARHYRAAVAK
jgi:hypothetical protein